jgi:hypothetical protein
VWLRQGWLFCGEGYRSPGSSKRGHTRTYPDTAPDARAAASLATLDSRGEKPPDKKKQYSSDNAGELVRGRRIYGRWDAAINAEYRCKTEVQALYSYTILPH